MACTDCLQNCREIISDQCVQYTGPTLPAPFNVCEGQQLPVFEAATVSVLQSALNGSGISPTPFTPTCTWLSQQFGILPLNLVNIVQILANGECTLYQLITALQQQVTNSQSGAVIDTACLTGLPATPSQPQIIQAIITTLCALNTTVAAFPTTYVQLSSLTSLVTPIVNSIISGGSSTTQYNSRMVPFAALPYFGPLSNFDNTGAGISSLGFTKVYLCNGQNGTPDIRGRVPVGAIRSVPGGALDPAVDPAANPNNPNWGLNDKAGETVHILITSEMPSHTHTYTDPGHSHVLGVGGCVMTIAAGHGTWSGGGVNSSGVPALGSTNTATTGITINSTGSSQPHNNIQPSIACYYIMYIP